MVTIEKTTYYTFGEAVADAEKNKPIWANENYDTRKAMAIFSGGAKWFKDTLFGWLACTREEELMIANYLASDREHVVEDLKRLGVRPFDYQLRVEKKYIYLRFKSYHPNFKHLGSYKLDRREYTFVKLRKLVRENG